eukprot:TRINITY_DN256_c0_g3_i1.p1 TRINITY_DN256_c0_g3~~TRINITY_DN256_c0_g3_i1.p1  ORF type:complete len:327 (-),score=78.97 TRINITY_DN256_c0_g3_i1:92-1072(-)
METSSLILLHIFMTLGGLFALFFILRCLLRGRPCPSKSLIESRTVLITRGDSPEGTALARELSARGGRIILGVEDLQRGMDIALGIRGETNGEVLVHAVQMDSIRSIRDFATRILETESKIHVLVNNHVIQWASYGQTEDGFELHWGINHMGNFVMTQLLLPLLHRAGPDGRILVLSSSLYACSKGIHWDDPMFRGRAYSASEAFAQSKLANILFVRELSRRLEGTGINTYAIDPGPIRSGLGLHSLRGLGYLKGSLALFCWFPWLRSSENGVQSLLYAVTDERLLSQSGFYYKDCAVQVTNEVAADMDAAYRLWEMSERMAALSS